MTINQCSFSVTKSQGGYLDFAPASMSIGPNATNPLMVAASNILYRSGENNLISADAAAGAAQTPAITTISATTAETRDACYMNGSNTIPCGT
jgi:hypothetical protein